MEKAPPRNINTDFLRTGKRRLAEFHTKELVTNDSALTELYYIQCELLAAIAQDIRDITTLESINVDVTKGYQSYPSQSITVQLKRKIRSWYDRLRG